MEGRTNSVGRPLVVPGYHRRSYSAVLRVDVKLPGQIPPYSKPP